MATLIKGVVNWLLPIAERWWGLVYPHVYGPDGWGWGPNSEELRGFGHFVWRQIHFFLWCLLLGWVSMLRNCAVRVNLDVSGS